MTEEANQAFIEKLHKLAAAVNAELNSGLSEPNTVSGLGLCAVQMQGNVTCLYLDNNDKSVSPGIRMAASILATCLKDEKNQRAVLLLNKALKLAEEALKVRSGEIISTKLH